MCTVTLNINESAIRKFNPALSSHEAINRWAQHQMDVLIEELSRSTIAEPPCTYDSIDDVIAESQQRMEEIECGKTKLIPHNEVRQKMK